MKCYRSWGDIGDESTVDFTADDVTGPGRWCVTVAFCGLISSKRAVMASSKVWLHDAITHLNDTSLRKASQPP